MKTRSALFSLFLASASAIGYTLPTSLPVEPSDTTLAAVYGTIIDAATKQPLAGARVVFTNRSLVGPAIWAPSCITGSDGSYRFSNIEPAPDSLDDYYMIDACDSSYGCSYINFKSLLPGQGKRIDLLMSKTMQFSVQVTTQGNSRIPLEGLHIATLYPKGDQAFTQIWSRTYFALSDTSGRVQFGIFAQGNYLDGLEKNFWDHVLGTTIRFSVSKPGYRTQIISKTLTVDSWQDSASVALEIESPVTSQTLSGSVIDWTGSADGLVVLFQGNAEGQPFVQFGIVAGNEFNISGIPDSISGGTLYVEGDSLDLVKADFTRDVALNSKRAVTAGLNPNSKSRIKGAGAGSPSGGVMNEEATKAAKVGKFNLLGQKVSGAGHETKGMLPANSRHRKIFLSIMPEKF